jgi:hypothetical protein
MVRVEDEARVRIRILLFERETGVNPSARVRIRIALRCLVLADLEA